MDEIKFPLSKKLKDQYSDDYEKIFLKRPVHNMKDEKLVELVNSNRDKITPDAKNTEQPSQEGIQDEEIKASEAGAIDNGSSEPNAGEGEQPSIDTTGEFKLNELDQATKDQAQKDREYEFNQYEQLFNEQADGELSTEEIKALNARRLIYNSSVKVYFDLFGKRPLEDMTTEQIDSAIKNEESRIATAKAAAAKESIPAVKEFDYDPETEMLIVNKKDKKDKRVINKVTYPFLKEGFDIVSETPKELLNRK